MHNNAKTRPCSAGIKINNSKVNVAKRAGIVTSLVTSFMMAAGVSSTALAADPVQQAMLPPDVSDTAKQQKTMPEAELDQSGPDEDSETPEMESSKDQLEEEIEEDIEEEELEEELSPAPKSETPPEGNEVPKEKGQEQKQTEIEEKAPELPRYTLEARLVELKRGRSSRHTLAVGELILRSPDGVETKVPFKSGGHGKYGHKSFLPCLKDYVEGCHYPLDWTSYAYNQDLGFTSMHTSNNKGSWLRLISLPEFTKRGASWDDVGRPNPGAFGIHPDGTVVRRTKRVKKRTCSRKRYYVKLKSGKTVRRRGKLRCRTRTLTRVFRGPAGSGFKGDGTLGCVGIPFSHQKQFFDTLHAIPKNQRPTILNILPSDMMAKKDQDKTNTSKPKIQEATLAR